MPPDSEVCSTHSGIITDIANLKNSDVEQWEAINRLQNRLPTWATLVISLLTFFLGLAVGYIRVK